MLDTSGYSALMRGDASARDVLASAQLVYIPVVAMGELYSGFRRGTRVAENIGQLRKLLSKPSVRVAGVTAETAARYAEIDVFLRQAGRPIPKNDVWIAASAMEHGCELLTYDAHFSEVPLIMIRPYPPVH
jgi:tRNA(fMet)-specific endonuclease VapC